jgi:hypothetical protein
MCTTYSAHRILHLVVLMMFSEQSAHCCITLRMRDVLYPVLVAGEMGPAASGQVTTEARPTAVPSTLLPSEPQRPPVAADVVSGECLMSLPYPQPNVSCRRAAVIKDRLYYAELKS